MFTKPAMFRFTVYATLAALTYTVSWVFVNAGLRLGLGL